MIHLNHFNKVYIQKMDFIWLLWENPLDFCVKRSGVYPLTFI
jgi:hypothetical protein